MRRIVLCFFLGLVCASCINDELCIETNPGILKIGFFDIDNPESSKSVTLDSIGVSGLPLNYPDFNDSTVTEFSLSLDPDSTISRFVFYMPDRADSLDVSYEVVPSIISIECGPELIYSQLDTLQQSFDSLVIEETVFIPEVERHLKIFL